MRVSTSSPQRAAPEPCLPGKRGGRLQWRTCRPRKVARTGVTSAPFSPRERQRGGSLTPVNLLASSAAFSGNTKRRKSARRRRFPAKDAWSGSTNTQVQLHSGACHSRGRVAALSALTGSFLWREQAAMTSWVQRGWRSSARTSGWSRRT